MRRLSFPTGRNVVVYAEPVSCHDRSRPLGTVYCRGCGRPARRSAPRCRRAAAAGDEITLYRLSASRSSRRSSANLRCRLTSPCLVLPPTDVIANSVSQLSHSFTGVFTRTYPLPHLLIISLSLSHAPAKAQGGPVGRGAAHVAFTGRHATNTSSQY